MDQTSLDCILADSRSTLLQLFIRGNPFRGAAGLTSQAQAIYQQLWQTQQLEGLIIYGSPYVLNWFISYLPPELPWVFTYGQNFQAQAIALSTLFGNMDNYYVTTRSTLDLQHNFGF